jgi:rod shape-determining protein MreD
VLAGLAARGIVIDVLVLATVTWSLRQRDAWGATFGFVLGLAADLDASHWLGRHALALTLLGYGVGRLSNTLVRDSPLTQLVLIALATALHQIWVTAFDATAGVQAAAVVRGPRAARHRHHRADRRIAVALDAAPPAPRRIRNAPGTSSAG